MLLTFETVLRNLLFGIEIESSETLLGEASIWRYACYPDLSKDINGLTKTIELR